MAREYTITSVQERDEWRPVHGSMMRDYAIALQGETGWIKLTQKTLTRPPREGETIYGSIESKQNANGTAYRKFKKENPQFGGNRSGGFGDSDGSQAPSNGEIQQQLDYIVKMLEELTGRRDVVHELNEAHDTVSDPLEGLI